MSDPAPEPLIREWVARHSRAFALVDSTDPHGPTTFVEVSSGKSLAFAFGAVVYAEKDRDDVRGGTYLRIQLDDGRQFGLAGIGFAFAPSFVSTGPLEGCPPVASFRDFEKLLGHLTHLIGDEHDDHRREALQTVTVLLAFLDGARAIGLDVAPEERRIEVQLNRLEKLPPD